MSAITESIPLEERVAFLADPGDEAGREGDQIGQEDDGTKTQDNGNATSIKARLYTSHFLSTWNSRVFEFGAVLFLAKLFPGTLLPPSVYALVRAASAICLSPAVGSYIDRTNRLKTVRVSIVGQRIAVILSCVLLWAISLGKTKDAGIRPVFFAVVCLFACVEKLCAVMNLIGVERDWVVVIAENTDCALDVLDYQMRRIDLFCKLVGPLAIALGDGLSTRVAIWTVLALSGTSILVEYFAIARVSDAPHSHRLCSGTMQVYREVPALQAPRMNEVEDDENRDPSLQGRLAKFLRSIYSSLRSYVKHDVFLPSMALSLLYFTVLSFSGQMITYLLSTGLSSFHVGVLRTVSVALEMSATWLAPLANRRVGVVRAGLWSITWQTLSILGAVSAFWYSTTPGVAAISLVAGVAISRVGLWSFDLCVQVLVQEVRVLVLVSFVASDPTNLGLC